MLADVIALEIFMKMDKDIGIRFSFRHLSPENLKLLRSRLQSQVQILKGDPSGVVDNLAWDLPREKTVFIRPAVVGNA